MEQQQPRSWSHLPDVCLLLVFKKLSTSDMIRNVGRVCTNWGKVQRVDLRSRNTLVIAAVRGNERILEKVRKHENPFGSNLIEHVRRENGLPWVQLKPLDQIEFDTLRVPDVLTETFTSLVMDTLPNMTHLTLVIYVPFDLRISSLHQLTRLISHYTTSLLSLKLYFKNDLPVNPFWLDNSEILVPLFNSINRLESLRHLTLNITNLVDSYPELSILSRLATFTSGVYYPPQSLLASLRQYATTGDDLRVECCSGITFNDLIGLNPQLASKFTRLSHVNAELHSNMRLFCQRFASLHTLELAIDGMSMAVLAQHLSQLPELINLKLSLGQPSHLLLPDEEEGVEEGEDPPQLKFTQVPPVRLLTLSIHTKSHHDTERLHLHQIFPNLQVLHFCHEANECNDCHYDYIYDFIYENLVIERNVQPEILTQIGHCMHLARQPFRLCVNLHTIKLDSDDEEVMRLLPQGLITRDQL